MVSCRCRRERGRPSCSPLQSTWVRRQSPSAGRISPGSITAGLRRPVTLAIWQRDGGGSSRRLNLGHWVEEDNHGAPGYARGPVDTRQDPEEMVGALKSAT
ncbi:hypothetical protein NDU88_005332 [Pleurodeles waltl]|uniref:Uncharacterized protein n=1 Tax=Pleurodeles waltl TaxID=8319 RepID=A0AAV7ULK5_PLEWA|nr:hypothetical protein NDU88_005332 [Pleurodeles waltl]